jgi:hypothetical protein
MRQGPRLDLNDRARVFLSASVGEVPVTKACEQLGITRQRFYELEERALTAFLEALEPKPAGRPPKEPDPTVPLQRQIDKLEKENQKLWLYVKTLRQLAGIEDEEKKR